MRKLFFVVGLILGVGAVNIARADDVTCPAGQYLNDAGACVACGSEIYYCPGDNMRHDCPDPITHVRTTFPDTYCNPTSYTSTWFYESSQDSLNKCRVLTWWESECGILYEYANYNPETNKYDTYGLHEWSDANPGYYLTAPGWCGRYAYYHDVLSCPAGAYCPGKERLVCNESNEAVVHTETFGLEICPDNTYSDAGATACTPCPHGYGNSGATADSHAGIASCNTPIVCNAGYYLNDNNECEICPLGYECNDNEKTRCMSRTVWGQRGYYADETGLATCKQCPENTYDTEHFQYYFFAAEPGAEFIHKTGCRAQWKMRTEHGLIGFSCHWGNAGYTEPDTYTTKCMLDILECDAGYEYKGPTTDNPVWPWRIWVPDYATAAQERCLPVGYGNYSPAGDVKGTACPIGNSTRTDTASGADACLPLCDAGMSRFHAGDASFPLWKNNVCASPALRVGTGAGTCCVNLESGTASGALNIDTGTATYHTVN